jgi:Zn-dependent protease
MLRSIPLGRLFGIPLYVHPTFLLLPAWVLLSHPGGGALTTALLVLGVLTVFGCIVLHELGHALAARHYGIATRDITLYPIGGVARLERMSERPVEELVIALAGPAVNLVIALLLAPAVLMGIVLGHGLGLTLSPTMDLLALALQFLTLVCVSNVVLLVFNLIPAFPMDGGRVLRALLSMGLGHLRATEIAAVVGLVLAVIGIVFALMPPTNLMMALLAGFVILAGQAELRVVRAREAHRRAQQLAPLVEPMRAPTVVLRADSPPPTGLTPQFSGFTWDQERGVWVAWRNGLPVAFWGPAE